MKPSPHHSPPSTLPRRVAYVLLFIVIAALLAGYVIGLRAGKPDSEQHHEDTSLGR